MLPKSIESWIIKFEDFTLKFDKQSWESTFVQSTARESPDRLKLLSTQLFEPGPILQNMFGCKRWHHIRVAYQLTGDDGDICSMVSAVFMKIQNTRDTTWRTIIEFYWELGIYEPSSPTTNEFHATSHGLILIVEQRYSTAFLKMGQSRPIFCLFPTFYKWRNSNKNR